LIAGGLIDVDRPAAGNPDGTNARATALLAALRGSPLIAGVERGHFDDSEPGLLRFEITLRLPPHALF
jgi:hypothetical protein